MSYALNHAVARERGLGTVPDVSGVPTALGVIKSKDGAVRYQITPEDVLWLARSVQFEAGNNAATAWTYAQRLVAFRSSSLARLAQAHSQPINPIWRRDGEKCRPGGPYHGRDECSETRLATRDRAASLPWSQIRPAVREVIVNLVTARLPNPVPRATDFANAPVSTGFLLRHPDAGVVLRAGNWYLAEGSSSAPRGGSNAWPADFVTVQSEGRIAGPSVAGSLRAATTLSARATAVGVLALGGGAAFAYYAWRRRKRRA